MATPHISAEVGDIAETIILVDEPKYSKHFATYFLKNPVLFNEIRGMLGYTGVFSNNRLSVLSVGVGIPSVAIYVNELLEVYGVKTIIYICSCNSLQKNIVQNDIILASGACTDNDFTRHVFPGDFAPLADYDLLSKAKKVLHTMATGPFVGLLLSTDNISHNTPEYYDVWSKYGVIGVDMSTAAIYTLAAKFHAKALTLSTVTEDKLDEDMFRALAKITLNILS